MSRYAQIHAIIAPIWLLDIHTSLEMQILMSVLYHTTTVMMLLLAIIPMEALPVLVMKDIMAVGTSVLVSSNEYLIPKCYLYGH